MHFISTDLFQFHVSIIILSRDLSERRKQQQQQQQKSCYSNCFAEHFNSTALQDVSYVYTMYVVHMNHVLRHMRNLVIIWLKNIISIK